MIGNLVISLLAGVFVAGVVGSGYVKAESSLNVVNGMVAENDSLVFDGKVYVPSIDFDVGFWVDVNESISTDYLYNYGFDGFTFESRTIDGFDDVSSFMTDFVGIGYHANKNGLPNNYTWVVDIYICVSSETISYNGNYYVLDGCEINPIHRFVDSSLNDLESSYTPNLYINGSDVDDSSSYGMNTPGLIGANISSISNFYKLSYSIRVNFLPSDCSRVFVGFGGQWCCNYRYTNGFTYGYGQGYGDGYSVGYAEGLNVSSTSFNGLFNAIADTPLRFLYGLFNFDLFGMSMLVIVLSLLTGLIVFGIVKKFWK